MNNTAQLSIKTYFWKFLCQLDITMLFVSRYNTHWKVYKSYKRILTRVKPMGTYVKWYMISKCSLTKAGFIAWRLRYPERRITEEWSSFLKLPTGRHASWRTLHFKPTLYYILALWCRGEQDRYLEVLLCVNNMDCFVLDQSWGGCRARFFLNSPPNFTWKITFIKILIVSFHSHLFTFYDS